MCLSNWNNFPYMLLEAGIVVPFDVAWTWQVTIVLWVYCSLSLVGLTILSLCCEIFYLLCLLLVCWLSGMCHGLQCLGCCASIFTMLCLDSTFQSWHASKKYCLKCGQVCWASGRHMNYLHACLNTCACDTLMCDMLITCVLNFGAPPWSSNSTAFSIWWKTFFRVNLYSKESSCYHRY